MANAITTAAVDERVRHVARLRRWALRPELGAIGGTIVAWSVFAIWAGDAFISIDGTLSYLEVASQLAILAVPVALLMIAGEFDLSVGSVIAAAGMLIAIPVVEFGWELWQALLLAVAGATVIGMINGLVVVKTGLPSFIVTLAAMFAVRGLTLVEARDITGRTQVGGLHAHVGEDNFFLNLFGGKVGDVPASFFWAVGFTLVATVVLMHTRFGNWIFSTGGDAAAARNMGVPVAWVKVTLFVVTALGATVLAAVQVLSVGSADVLRGGGKEFEAIAAAVIGGTLLTGGFGSAIGAFFGALLFGMVSQGIFFTGTDSDWFLVFLGGMVLLAVLVNRYIRAKLAEAG
jgi:simple sugar transport system permease protein